VWIQCKEGWVISIAPVKEMLQVKDKIMWAYLFTFRNVIA
jgi:hypothetical protein